MSIAEDVQGFEPGDLITLFVLDATALGGDIQRFTGSAWSDKPITFDGDVYTPIEVDAEGFEWNGQGPLPRPTLRISNVNQVAQALVREFNDGVGATVQRIRTFSKYLDDGVSPDPLATFPIDTYVVDRKATQNRVFITWELASVMDQEGRKLPNRQILRDFCDHRYRVFDPVIMDFDYTNATCPYVGVASFDEKDKPTIDALDRCSKRLTGCQTRFGENGVLPTRAFPGVARARVFR